MRYDSLTPASGAAPAEKQPAEEPPAALSPALLTRAEARLPRYTSYPTAAQFGDDVDAACYAGWLEDLPADTPLSLYLHIPFCQQLCWYCGCHTTITCDQQRIGAYAELLNREIGLVAGRLQRDDGRSGPVHHLHLGGGSPNSLCPADLLAVMQALNAGFTFAEDAEIACELDPRHLSDCFVAALASSGFNRASLGVQDLNPHVQKLINREQPLSVVESAVSRLRRLGIRSVNLDIMYGLPDQRIADVHHTIEQILTLTPDRVAVFGYAHVPWFKKHQQMIATDRLPGTAERLEQAEAAREALRAAGYVEIGMDHYAHPQDRMAQAWNAGQRQRNFQGFTTDNTETLIGMGVSAIGNLPQGYVQNASHLSDYRSAIETGALPVARGIALSDENRLRRAVVQRIMCELPVDLPAIALAHDRPADHFACLLPQLGELATDGLVSLHQEQLCVTERGRRFTRTIAAVFDEYLSAESSARHSAAS